MNISCLSQREIILETALTSSITSIDPAVAYDDGSLTVVSQTYEPLYEYHYLKRPYQVIPLIAESLPIWNELKTEATIKIKKGVAYHNHPIFKGKKRFVIAQDFINQIKRIAFNPIQSSGLWLFKSKLKGFDEFSKKVGESTDLFFSESISGLSAPDDYTLKMSFTTPVPDLSHLLALTFVVPVPLEVLEAKFDLLSNEMIGTGPFIPIKLDKKNEVVFKSFTGYRNSLYPTTGDRYSHTRKFLKNKKKTIPFVDGIRMRVIQDNKLLWEDFLKKKLDWIEVPKTILASNITPIGTLKKNLRQRDIELLIFPSFSSLWLSFNMNDPILGNNLNLRKAIAYGIDYERYLSVVTQNTTQRANSIYFPGTKGYNPSKVNPVNYDVEKAKVYLKEAGFPNGEGLPAITYSTRGISDQSLKESHFFKEELAKIGINIKIKEIDFPTFLKEGREGHLQFFTDGWIFDLPDPRNILQLLISPSSGLRLNKSQYQNTKVDKLISEIGFSTDDEKVLSLLEQIEDEVFKDLPWILLYYNRNYYFKNANIKNLRVSSFIRNYFKYIQKDN